MEPVRLRRQRRWCKGMRPIRSCPTRNTQPSIHRHKRWLPRCTIPPHRRFPILDQHTHPGHTHIICGRPRQRQRRRSNHRIIHRHINRHRRCCRCTNVNRFEANGSINFSGFDMRQYSSNQGNSDFLEALIDTITQSFRFETNQDPYYTSLTPKLYVGAMYKLTEKVNVSALTRTEFFDRLPHFALTLAASYSPLPFLHGTLSYSIMNNRFDQLGFGISVGSGPMQFYLVSDHIPVFYVRDSASGLIWPYSAQTMNFRLGMNLVFGCGENNPSGKPAANRKNWKSKNSCPAYD